MENINYKLIKNRKDLHKWIIKDQINSLGRKYPYWELCLHNIIGRLLVEKYLVFLRHEEYYYNTNHKFLYLFYKIKKNRVGIKTGLEIPKNTVGPGVSAPHMGSRIINGESKIGENFRIHANVQIGANGGKPPVLGNNIYIGPGAKLFGDIYIADNIKIGANAVVNKSFYEKGITIAGVPAKKVSL